MTPEIWDSQVSRDPYFHELHWHPKASSESVTVQAIRHPVTFLMFPKTRAWKGAFVHNSFTENSGLKYGGFPLRNGMPHTVWSWQPHTNITSFIWMQGFSTWSSLAHTHTIFFLSPLSCDKICPLFMFFEGMLGSKAARAPGTDMNKWTVLHGSMRRVAKQPKQELLHPLSKGLLSKRPQLRLAWSCGYAHASPNMHMHTNV